MDIGEMAALATQFDSQLSTIKQDLNPRDFEWYPYGTLNNFHHLNALLHGENRDISRLVGEAPIVDIGAADGDSAFFVESLGMDAHIVDYAPTNYNGCRGARLLRDHLQSRVTVSEVDLDAKFDLPDRHYGFAFFLGILYHLKNPFGALESLARSASYAVISTRIARFNRPNVPSALPDVNIERLDLSSIPVAYLVDPYETNNDQTNYWIFTEIGLRRILNRTGWDILDFIRVGDTQDSDPATNNGDERAFCLVRSRS